QRRGERGGSVPGSARFQRAQGVGHRARWKLEACAPRKTRKKMLSKRRRIFGLVVQLCPELSLLREPAITLRFGIKGGGNSRERSRGGSAAPSSLLKHPVFRDDHDDARFRNVVSLPVFFQVESNLRVFRDVYITVNDGAADARVPAYVDMGKQDAVLDLRVAVDSHIGRNHAVCDAPARDYRSHRDDGVDG